MNTVNGGISVQVCRQRVRRASPLFVGAINICVWWQLPVIFQIHFCFPCTPIQTKGSHPLQRPMKSTSHVSSTSQILSSYKRTSSTCPKLLLCKTSTLSVPGSFINHLAPAHSPFLMTPRLCSRFLKFASSKIYELYPPKILSSFPPPCLAPRLYLLLCES